MTRARIAVLASGGGSNCAALVAHLAALGDTRPADVVAVLSDRAAAPVLQRAREWDVDGIAVARRADSDLPSLEAALVRVRPDIVVLAGYLRLVPESVVRAYDGRMLNVHPALLPAFGGPGMHGRHVHEAVLAAGAAVSGATVHFVSEVYDAGAIAAQWPVPVLPGDDADTLAARVLAAEHWLYPRVVVALARGDLALGADGRAAWHAPPPHAELPPPAALSALPATSRR